MWFLAWNRYGRYGAQDALMQSGHKPCIAFSLWGAQNDFVHRPIDPRRSVAWPQEALAALAILFGSGNHFVMCLLVKVHLIFFHYHLTTLPVVLYSMYIYIVKILPPQTNAKVMESIVQWDGRLPVLTDAMWIQVWEDRIHMALPKNGRKIPWLMVDLRFPILLVTILYGFSRKFSILGMHSRPWTFRREQCWAASGGRCAAQLAAPTGGN